METKDWIMVLAVVLGPLVAVQISQWLERKRVERDMKFEILRTQGHGGGPRIGVIGGLVTGTGFGG